MRLFPFCLFILVLLVFPCLAHAQKGNASVSGSIRDHASGLPVPYASAAIQDLKDSAVVTGGVSGEDGQFELLHIPYGQYRLIIVALGYKKWTEKITFNENTRHITLDSVRLEKLSVTLQTAVISDVVPVRFKGDTIEFNAAAYKMHPNAMVEDLLKKLPGVQVDKDGNVTAMGQKVDKVTVDSKSFFGNNPKLATKNLPADIVDKVQVSEDKEAAAQNPNQDQSQQPKAINIVLKPGKRNGFFGSARFGYGTDQRYDGNIAGFHFTDKYQLSLIGTFNNVNSVGFDMNDFQQMQSAGSKGGISPGSGGITSIRMSNGAINTNDLFSSSSGITTSTGGGVNYSTDLTPKLNFSANYFYGGNSTVNDQTSFRQNILPDTTFYQSGNAVSQANRFNHQAGINLRYKIDSVTNLSIEPSFGFTQSNSVSGNTYTSLAKDSSLVNSGVQNYSDNDNLRNFGLGMRFNHQFRQKGRNLWAFFNFSQKDEQDNGLNISNNKYYQQPAGGGIPDSINQQFNYHNINSSFYGYGTYIQPFDTLNSLQLSYNLQGNGYNNNKQTFDFNHSSQKYDFPDSLLSNNYQSFSLQQNIGVNYTHEFKHFSVSPGISFMPSFLQGENAMKDSTFQRSYFYIAPTIRVNFKLSKNRHLGFNTFNNVSLPDITQLQPVIDNSNPLYLTKGNPGLKPSIGHSFNINYNAFDIAHNLSTFSSLGYNFTQNAIVTSSYFDKSTGIQTSQPVNVNGTYSFYGNFNLGIPVKKVKGLSLRPNIWGNYNKSIVPVNGQNNDTRSMRLNGGLNIDYSGQEWLDLTVSANEGYNNSRYSLTPQTNSSYLSQRYGANFTLYLPLSFTFNSDISYIANTGMAQGYNKNYVLWNGYIGKDFLKSKLLTVKLSAYDLLKQNIQLQRTIQSNYIQDTRNNVLTQYFMLTVQYRLQMFNGKAKAFERKRENHKQFMFFGY